MIWKFKSCPRCQGDIYLTRQEDGWNDHCLACGYERPLRGVVKPLPPAHVFSNSLTGVSRPENRKVLVGA